ncbi:VTC domain-domain-containing protein [Catenaria anguillulae PL171]|uniref:Vacuolar transporter chaperone complex subunit 4 n=1 Tax=Catenaria anguillulae PL171 TaxID=765915 RepID=A0A1Y2HG00_9FUNG|nr:VTC domain-domain-containing protein [Catenaria anguillulae PL171]
MKFGAHLATVQYPEWRFYYVDYDAIKKQLKEMAKHGTNCPEELEKEFIDFLDRELTKVVNFQAIKSGELNSRANHCETIINNIIANPTATPQVTRIGRVEEELARITTEVNELAKYARLNYTGFLKALKKHDKHTTFQLKPMFIGKLNANPFYRENFDPLILKLSKLYDTVRNGGETDRKNVQADGGSQSFVRRTTKYWVHPDNVTEVKLRVLKNLPVLVFGSAKEYDPAITSIYFDNEQFDLYRGRLEKSEGAQAIRFRWYGPVTNQEIFMERKTHREDWTGEKSVKERFPLKEKYVNDFVSGAFTMDKQIEKLRERGAKSEKELENLATLSSEMQEAILTKKLKPTMRTFYNRTAFQLPGDARVRISLDTELTMVREDNYDGKARSGTNWRRMDIGTDWPFAQLDEADVHRFPYAVLEVKLQTHVGAEPPAWVTDLINSHLVEEVPKFSKFIHGCATLLENRVSLLPFWLPQMSKDIRKPGPEAADGQDAGELTGAFSIEEVRVRKGKAKARGTLPTSNGASFVSSRPASEHTAVSIDGHASGEEAEQDGEDEAEDEDDAAESPVVDETTGLLRGVPRKDKNKGILAQMTSLVRKLHVREKREKRQRQRTNDHGVPIASSSARGPVNSLIPETMNNKRIIIPVRVEPKVFFANERTFLAWMHFSSVIAGLALGLLNFGDRIAQIAGIIFTINAMGIMMYGLYLFLWRAEKIRNREAGPYDDRGGPTFVVLTLFFAMSINFYLKFGALE